MSEMATKDLKSGDQGGESQEANRERARRKADGNAYVAWICARCLWMSGSETRAQIAAQEARFDVDTDSPYFAEWRRLVQLNMGLRGMLERLTDAPR